MSYQPPETFNIADYFLHDRAREGRGERTAILCRDATGTYRDVQRLAHRFANLLRALGVQPEQRVILSLPDGPEFVGALFGVLEMGAVVVMVNPVWKGRMKGFFGVTHHEGFRQRSAKTSLQNLPLSDVGLG